eukprot:GDKI01044313.1.p1 GENE.GDKI01044313.1~~GDKI01044313.1.p1  ORF type:complete len:303 (-),score=49.97 GDKI01044313.1:376-1284(-)
MGLFSFMDEYKPYEKNLLWWNIGCGCLHLFQACISLAMAEQVERINLFKLPLNTAFTKWEDYGPVAVLERQALLPFAQLTTGFAWMSAFAHFCVLYGHKTYIADLKRGLNRFRWYEYAVSSSLMIGLIAMLFGVYDIFTLIALMSVNACMNLFGMLMETQNYWKRKAETQVTPLGSDATVSPSTVDWSPFLYGCFAGVIPWAIIIAYPCSSPDAHRIPEFVWAILGVYFVCFNTFPVNMYLQYAKIGWWSDARWQQIDPSMENGGYIFGEKMYQVQSLVSKSLLLWLVIGSVNQPNEYTRNV